jgi:C4-dicarboxylate-specific signal transduction histidine kinase
LRAEIAERKRADTRSQELHLAFSHAGRTSAAGQMAAALAHELNQPLTAVTNSANAAKRLTAQIEVGPIETLREIMGEIVEQSLRAGQIIHRLRSFIARGESEKQIENVATLFETASEFARTGYETTDARLELYLEPQASHVFANGVQIQQVLFHLTRNALEALVGIKPAEITVTAARQDQDMVEIAVTDNGPGVAEEVAGNLFEPFVSTHPDAMGLGLPICRTIVEAHGGTLRYEQAPLGGTTFRFTLPIAGPMGPDRA